VRFILTLLDSRIYPTHQSAKDYLASEAALGNIFPSGTYAIHRSIVEKLVAAMTKALRRDIYNLKNPGILINEITYPPKQDPLLGVGYSCVYWIDHACEPDKSDFPRSRRSRLVSALKQPFASLKKSIYMRDIISTFFLHHFLYWLEALSLLGIITNGVFSLIKLRNNLLVSILILDSSKLI